MNIVTPVLNLSAIGPELILSLTAMGLLLINVLAKKGAKGAIPYLSLAGIVVALVLCISLWGKSEYAFNRMVVVDNYSLFFKIIFLITACLEPG